MYYAYDPRPPTTTRGAESVVQRVWGRECGVERVWYLPTLLLPVVDVSHELSDGDIELFDFTR